VKGSNADYRIPNINLKPANTKRFYAFPLKKEHKLHPTAQKVSTFVLLN